jgi:hypothetical protein
MGPHSAYLCMFKFIGANKISGLIKMVKIIKANDQLLVVVSLAPSNPSALHVLESDIYDHLTGQSC